MSEFSYKETGKNIGWNFSKINPLVVRKGNYNYWRHIVDAITPETVMLDIGCGSAEKTLRYTAEAKQIVCIDIEPEMLNKANENLNKFYSGAKKEKFEFKLMDGDGLLGFPDETFDLVVSRHCGANMAEVYRVLKPGGIFVSEDVSKYDCWDLKQHFGRGQGFEGEPEYFNMAKSCIQLGFTKIEFEQVEEDEFYPNADQLKYLLYNTPILGGYTPETDDEQLNEYISTHTTDKGIRLNRRLYGFRLVK